MPGKKTRPWVAPRDGLPGPGGLLIADKDVDIFLPVRFYCVCRARWLKLHPEATAPERNRTVAQPSGMAASV